MFHGHIDVFQSMCHFSTWKIHKLFVFCASGKNLFTFVYELLSKEQMIYFCVLFKTPSVPIVELLGI